MIGKLLSPFAPPFDWVTPLLQRGKFDRKTLRDATSAFRRVRNIAGQAGRGCISSGDQPARGAAEAANRHVLIERIRHEARIDLEIISGEEEAHLVRVATLRSLRNVEPPRFILDLGGGSLEVSELRKGILQRSVGLPLGTVAD